MDEVLRTFRGADGVLGAMGVYRAAFTSVEQTEPLARNKVRVPVVALGGDKGLGAEVGRMVGVVASAPERETIADCGHFLPEERPDAVVRHVLAMLAQERRPGPAVTGDNRSSTMTDTPSAAPALPPDDPRRHLAVARRDTAGRYCLVDMHVPPGGGPAPHRHDIEETFTVLDGEIEITFRGQRSVARAGETVNIPANAPHSFTNRSGRPARLLCMCTPAG